jgi:hypothetical protein
VKDIADTDADDADGELTLTSISIDTTMQREHAREQRANSTFVPEWDANAHPSWTESRTAHERRCDRVANETHTRVDESARPAYDLETDVDAGAYTEVPQEAEAIDAQSTSVIGRFVVDKQSRTAQLEALLDSHIEYLRLESDDELQRFVLSTSTKSQLNGSANASIRQSHGTG